MKTENTQENTPQVKEDLKLLNAPLHIKRSLAELGNDKDLDILIHSEEPYVKIAIAKHGRDKDLDILVHDEEPMIRITVAEYGRDKDLDILVHDEDPFVDIAVARYGRDKDLDILVNSDDEDVQRAVLCHSRDNDLDLLVHSRYEEIRKEAVSYCREKDLDVLVKDNSKDVSLRAKFKKFDLKTKREIFGNYHIDILAYNDDQNIRQKAHELIDRLREEVSKNSINEFEIREINAAIKDFEKECSENENNIEIDEPSDFMKHIEAVVEETKREQRALTEKQTKPFITQVEQH
ncbi:MAG TPA: hypothetical protein DD395_05605 [Lachnospiraceae bacterium]|nr:hypothetical protein [Lachnospiraceae bacterium]